MRPLSPAFIVATLALALASGGALAQATTSSATTDTGASTTTNGVSPGVTVPGIVIAADPSLNANGERLPGGNTSVTVNTPPAATPTPLFELTARPGAAREARRRARGDEPRVYGIAPRTDRDLTRQMPDDPVIRY